MAAATAEAARSSSSSSTGSGGGGGSSADSYVGSLISLTSKSEIRYEGVLFNINTQESTIGLRNVRSFGTEGRKKDGLQVPPSDKIYEFILFRGTDIKDLQVKSSPPVQTATPVHNDPAIIQSQYPQAATASMNLPSSGNGSLTDPSSHASSSGLPRPTFQGSLPQYQPDASLESWGPSHLLPTTNGSGLAMPMYWQGYYGPSNGVQAPQQALLRPTPGLSMPPSMMQSVQYPAMNASNTSASPLSESPPLLPPFSTSNLNLPTSTLPSSRSSAMVSDSTNLTPDRVSTQTLPSNLPLASPLTTAVDKIAIASPGSYLPKTVPDPIMPFKRMSEPPSSIMRTSSSVLNEGKTPLVTPGQILQPGPPVIPSLQSSQIAQKDVQVVQVSSPELSAPPPTTAAAEVQKPILPLPSQPEHKVYGAPMYTYHTGRGGRGRGRENEISRSATRFEEDFDFTAMNEKFNKDEVWGHLGKTHKAQDRDDLLDEDDVGSSKLETKPVYVKDDFFDSISCDALDGGSRNGRARFSQQLRRDTDTSVNFSHHWGSRGGWGPGRGGRSGGGYYGRGYGYAGRGRGYGMSHGSF
ncbi:protein decapping 5-like [Populus alba x Populus x berolinensis]|uniref:Protein decapping 5-like n=2 Tax=Populus alba x Populus x berolinensis TaxID=444605 RepID=A0AAD6R1M5_9ROSI|nr:protein decapping 5-like [Populus alba x Populus x berolinensis]